MNQQHSNFLISIAALLVGLLILSTSAQAELLARTQLQEGAPQVISFQGQVKVGGSPFTGTGSFKFAVVNRLGDTIYWTNDGTTGPEPKDAITSAVSQGLFNVLLGDTSIPHMVALPADVFAGTERYLRVWFSPDGSTFIQLSPDQRIAAVPYALQAEEAKEADLLDGLHASAFATSAHNHWGQSWTGTGTGLTLSGGATGLSGSGSTIGVYGSSSTAGAKGVQGVSSATTGAGSGIYGQSNSYDGFGGYFYNSSTTGSAVAVYGYTNSTAGYGGYFVSDNTTAVATKCGVCGRDDSDTGFGVAGHNYYGGVGVGAWSYDGNLIEAFDGDYPGGTLRFYVDQSGNIYADGGYGTFGASTLDGATHVSSSLQSTEAWLEDFGRARLVDGAAVVAIAADFGGMADLTAEYHVFLTPLGDSQGLYVSNLTPTSFEVHEQGGGKSSIEFSYRIVARPAGVSIMRLPTVNIPIAEGMPERLPEGEK